MIRFGKAWFNKNQMANIFRFAAIADRYRITYNSLKENTYRIVKFKRNNNSLYVYKPKASYLEEVKARDKVQGISNIITFMIENRLGFTKREIEDAKEARRLYHILCLPNCTKL